MVTSSGSIRHADAGNLVNRIRRSENIAKVVQNSRRELYAPNCCVIPALKNAKQVESSADAGGKPLSAEKLKFIKAAVRS